MLFNLHIIYDHFHTVSELTSHDRDNIALKAYDNSIWLIKAKFYLFLV